MTIREILEEASSKLKPWGTWNDKGDSTLAPEVYSSRKPDGKPYRTGNQRRQLSTDLIEYYRIHKIPVVCANCKKSPKQLGGISHEEDIKNSSYQVTFELDHKNGKVSDNRLANLRFLCPNCHSRTNTWRGRKDTEMVNGVEVALGEYDD